MSLIEILKNAQSQELIDVDGEPVAFDLLEPYIPVQIGEIEHWLPCPMPPDIRELLQFCSGVDGPLDQLQFANQDRSFGYEEIFPHPIELAGDGFGNFWVVDLTPESTTWGPIYFACHDAPVILYQSRDLAEFLTEVVRMYQPPHKSLIDDVQEDRLYNVWEKNPGAMTQLAAAASSDAKIRAFAAELEPEWFIVDLRDAKPGQGFSWGRFGPRTEVKRAGNDPIFAYRKPASKSLFARLLGR